MSELLIFYFFAALLVLSAVLVVTVRNPVHAALFLVLSFFSSAAVWLLLRAEFLAIVLVLVYVGAVMVLFLFVVMMLNVKVAPLREGFTSYLPAGLLAAGLMLAAMGLVVGDGAAWPLPAAPVDPTPPVVANTALLGRALFTEYLYPFEIAGAVLLAAIIAAISLTMRPPRARRAPPPERQVVVTREERVRLVDLKTERDGAVENGDD